MHGRDAGLASLVPASRGVRRRAGLVGTCLALSSVILCFLLATVVPARLAESAALITLVLGAAAAIGVLARSRRRLRSQLSLEALVPEAEEAARLQDGELQAALELVEVGRGESAGLAAAHRTRVAQALRGRAADAVFPGSHRLWHRRLLAGISATAVLAGLLALSGIVRPAQTARTARIWAAPWHVLAATPLPPIRVEATGQVPRGATTPIRVWAEGRANASLFEQTVGEPVRTRSLELDSAGRAETASAPVRAVTRVWVEDEKGRSSETVEIRPLDPILFSSLSIELRYPPYLRRSPETLPRPFPALVIPEGTSIGIRGQANGSLERVSLAPPSGDAAVEFGVKGNEFSGSFRPRKSGDWAWQIEASSGPRRVVPPASLDIALVDDRMPTVRILHPEGDRMLGTALQLPIVVDARDDIGVVDAELVSWRVSANGSADAPLATPIPPEQAARRVILRPVLDVGERELLPGDVVFYFARVRDGHPGHGFASSDTLQAFRPTLDRLRGLASEEFDTLAARAARIAEAMGNLGRQAREAEVQARASAAESDLEGSPRGRSEGAMSYEATEEARAVLGKAEELEAASAEMQGRLGQLEDLAEALLDPALADEMRRLQELYGRLLEADLAEAIEALRGSLQELGPEELHETLEGLATDAERLRDELERSAALLESAAVKQGLQAARNAAEDLLRSQNEMAVAAAVDSAWRSQQRDLANDARQLTEAVAQLAERLEGDLAVSPTAEALDSLRAAGAATSSAEREMERAAGSQAEASARGAARAAAERMEQSADALSMAEGAVNRDWSAEAAAALERAFHEALALADEQRELARRFDGREALEPPTLAARQAALRVGLDHLFAGLVEAGRRTALLDRAAALAAADAANGMDELLTRLRETVPGGSPARSDGDAVAEALNDLAARLLATQAAVQAASAGTAAQKALEQLAQAARLQESVAQESGSLLLMQRAGRPVGSRLEQLAQRQAEVEHWLREMAEPARAPEGVLARPEELAEEAADLVRRLEAGSLDAETLERQQALFRRLLDAGRSLEKEDEAPDRRESRPGAALPSDVPPLDPGVLSGPRFPHPDEASLRDLPPAYRWMVLDYFDRLNRDLEASEGQP